MSTLTFLNSFTESWMRGAGSYLDVLNSMNKFKGSLKGKKIDEVKGLLFEPRFLEQVKL